MNKMSMMTTYMSRDGVPYPAFCQFRDTSSSDKGRLYKFKVTGVGTVKATSLRDSYQQKLVAYSCAFACGDRPTSSASALAVPDVLAYFDERSSDILMRAATCLCFLCGSENKFSQTENRHRGIGCDIGCGALRVLGGKHLRTEQVVGAQQKVELPSDSDNVESTQGTEGA